MLDTAKAASAVALLVFLIVIAGVALYRVAFHPLRRVPGPWYAAISDAWITSHLLALRRCRAIDDLFRVYGPVVRAGPDRVYFNDPNEMRTVYGSSDFSKSTFYKSLLTNSNDHSMTCLDHATHAARRKGWAPHYTPSNIQLFQDDLCDYVDELVQVLQKVGETKAVDALVLFRHLMVDVVGLTAFGHRIGAMEQWSRGVDDACSRAINDFPKRGLARSAMPPWLWDKVIARVPIPRWQVLCDSDAQLSAFVRERLEDIRRGQEGDIFADDGKKTMLSRLMRHYVPPSATNFAPKPKPVEKDSKLTTDSPKNQQTAFRESIPMPDEDIISEGVGHMVAAADTTSSTLSYLMWTLSRRPDIVASIRADDSSDHTYVDAVVKEALRLFSAVAAPFERVVPAGGRSISGYELPAGTLVGAQPWSLHRAENTWGSDAKTFRPERWLGGTVGSVQRASFAPFGSGSRVCGGQHLANVVLRLVVPALVNKFDVVCPPQTTEKTMWVCDAFVVFPLGLKCDLVFKPRTADADA